MNATICIRWEKYRIKNAMWHSSMLQVYFWLRDHICDCESTSWIASIVKATSDFLPLLVDKANEKTQLFPFKWGNEGVSSPWPTWRYMPSFGKVKYGKAAWKRILFNKTKSRKVQMRTVIYFNKVWLSNDFLYKLTKIGIIWTSFRFDLGG